MPAASLATVIANEIYGCFKNFVNSFEHQLFLRSWRLSVQFRKSLRAIQPKFEKFRFKKFELIRQVF